MRALVVDDSRAMRVILKRILGGLGFEVLEASHGREALAVLGAAGAPDLAMIDWNMPEMNGYELVCALRADRGYDKTRLVLVTSEVELGHMVKALDAGADEYVMKPFTGEDVHDKLRVMGMVA